MEEDKPSWKLAKEKGNEVSGMKWMLGCGTLDGDQAEGDGSRTTFNGQ